MSVALLKSKNMTNANWKLLTRSNRHKNINNYVSLSLISLLNHLALIAG